MEQRPAEGKKQYIAVAIIIAVSISGGAILIALTQQTEDGVILDTNPRQSSDSPASTAGPDSTEQPVVQSPQIAVSPDSSAPDGQVMIQGTGFEPNENVAVIVGSTVAETTPPAVAADSSGEFSAIVIVPELPSGQYQLVARGEDGSAAAESLTVA